MYFTDEKRLRLMKITDSIDIGFKMENQYYKRFIAVNALKHNKSYDSEKVKDLIGFMKKHTKLFSPFRTEPFVLASLLHISAKNPEGTFQRLVEHADLLKKNGFKQAQYLPLTSYCLDSLLYDEKIQDMAIQTRSYKEELVRHGGEVFREMKSHHPWITHGEDYALALLIAHNNETLERVEKIYCSLKIQGFHRGNGLQSFANILTLAKDNETTVVERAMEIKRQCELLGFKLNQGMYPGLGLMTLIDNEKHYIKSIIELVKELHGTKKYKWINRDLLFMFAVLLVSEDIKDEISSKTIFETALTITVEQIVTAQTAVLVSAISASTIASTTTH